MNNIGGLQRYAVLVEDNIPQEIQNKIVACMNTTNKFIIDDIIQNIKYELENDDNEDSDNLQNCINQFDMIFENFLPGESSRNIIDFASSNGLTILELLVEIQESCDKTQDIIFFSKLHKVARNMSQKIQTLKSQNSNLNDFMKKIENNKNEISCTAICATIPLRESEIKDQILVHDEPEDEFSLKKAKKRNIWDSSGKKVSKNIKYNEETNLTEKPLINHGVLKTDIFQVSWMKKLEHPIYRLYKSKSDIQIIDNLLPTQMRQIVEKHLLNNETYKLACLNVKERIFGMNNNPMDMDDFTEMMLKFKNLFLTTHDVLADNFTKYEQWLAESKSFLSVEKTIDAGLSTVMIGAQPLFLLIKQRIKTYRSSSSFMKEMLDMEASIWNKQTVKNLIKDHALKLARKSNFIPSEVYDQFKIWSQVQKEKQPKTQHKNKNNRNRNSNTNSQNYTPNRDSSRNTASSAFSQNKTNSTFKTFEIGPNYPNPGAIKIQTDTTGKRLTSGGQEVICRRNLKNGAICTENHTGAEHFHLNLLGALGRRIDWKILENHKNAPGKYQDYFIDNSLNNFVRIQEKVRPIKTER